MKLHQERKHSKFSASGAEKWLNCSGSVALSEGLPDKDTPWALEGTKAHEVLEHTLLQRAFDRTKYTREMFNHATEVAKFILGIYEKHPGSELLVETRIQLDFIHADAFGTFDSSIVDHFGILHVFDYKFGKSHAVSPIENLQMIFYGLGLAHQYDYNFKKVRLWIIQPRVKGYDGPTFWDITIRELKKYISKFKTAIKRTEEYPKQYIEGSWCHFCKAKQICPLKTAAKTEKALTLFQNNLVQKGEKYV